MTEPPLLVHASSVAFRGRGLLITGPSGSGKSGLTLQLMALGADLVADDQTELIARGGRLIASPPATTAGLIEARYLGLMNVPFLRHADIALVLDMGRIETERLPPERTIRLAGITCALAYCPPTPHLAASILCWLAHGRHA
ncbi:MAG: serine kinase [Pseudorhodobacter sp.]|nr:MAG: serine kinase [Pseudorhodobacter sp.]